MVGHERVVVWCQCVWRSGSDPLAIRAELGETVWRWFTASGRSHDTGTLLLLRWAAGAGGRGRSVQRAGAAGYVLGGEGCRELARVLMFRTVDGGGVGRMHFLN